MSEYASIAELKLSKTPTELNDGLDPEVENQYYQGKSMTSDGTYVGTYAIFIFVALLTGSIVFYVWQVFPRVLAKYVGLDTFFNFLPDQYWALAVSSIFVSGFWCIVFCQLGVMKFFEVGATDYRMYTDSKRTEITDNSKLNYTVEENAIPPIEDCEINRLAEMVYS
ncbi:hypothetical protein EIN_154440 [Entamoeba invadens IP1]|uniref:PIG-P domain-containing protein n=1 Tax=Entamoeba invadens IP1 TaxID=370355 RepID=A0A0A1U979_ENTIV|nr:hypothetical protein EIN_154440 [Entamoeba invadens IP1]ELP91377.1 hypothetical protein EIN_154440 [Entamoeba invadens IP1]|eukprot:XP_004258148.1 hypothetical protein EIN_154440 [Entamoeba invadens IP1]